MLRLTLVLALASLAAAHCSWENRKEVQEIWHSVWGSQFAGRRVAVAKAVFQDLFNRDPDAKALFTRVNVDDMDSPEFEAHCLRVTNGLDTVIGLLDDATVLNEQLGHLHTQHEQREGVTAEHFAIFARSMAGALDQVAPCFNHRAWDDCFQVISDGIAHDL
uniref:Extracellular globin n=2 Tax=Pectinaria gouldii TaxID=260746 RepID=C0LT99_PECGU|nr:globin-like protein [Pectinaria gouldii]